MIENIIRGLRRSFVGAGVAATAIATPAFADCDGVVIGARFTEAVQICKHASGPRDGAAGYRAATVADMPATVSVTMPGYRARLAKAARAVQVSGRPHTDSLVVAVAQRYRIDPHLLASIVHTESAGRAGAISNKGALGLMQVMPGTARGLGVRHPRAMLNDPVLALSTGAAYLKQLQGRLGNNVPLVVAAYNAGPGAVAKARGIPHYRETRGYVAAVMGRYAAARGAAR
ncbi:soluble lytic murein transglycosylase-like protein [Sphingomonas sp. UYAg733]